MNKELTYTVFIQTGAGYAISLAIVMKLKIIVRLLCSIDSFVFRNFSTS